MKAAYGGRMKTLKLFCFSLFAGAVLMAAKPAGTDSRLYLSPEKVSVTARQSVPVEIRVNVKKIPVNSVQAVLKYPADKLKIESVDSANSAFEVKAEERIMEGSLRIVRASLKGLKGDLLISKIIFTPLAAGDIPIEFTLDETLVLSHAGSQNTLKQTKGALITVQ